MDDKKKRQSMILYVIIAIAAIVALNSVVYPNMQRATVKDVSYDQMLDQVDEDQVEKLVFNTGSNQITYTLKDEANVTYRTTYFPNDNTLADRLKQHNVNFSAKQEDQSSGLWLYFLLSYGLPIIIFVGIGWWLNRRMKKAMGDDGPSMSFGSGFGMGGGLGKSSAKEVKGEETGVTFKDVAGQDEAKESLEEIVSFLKKPEKYNEIDAVGKKRDMSINSNDEREQTLNQLLSEMDGFDNHKGIVVLAATNRPETLDPALLRPGRFDRRIPVELPDLAGREAILKIHANDVKMEPGIDLGIVARSTPGASGADLANIINEAALRAVRNGRKRVTQEDLLESVDVVIAGEKKKSTVLSPHEKEVVAYHETGHAIVAATQKGTAPVTKITIVPRTSGALGFTMQVEEDEHFLTTRTEAKQKIATLCGGRAAEELIFGEMTTGASNDIEKATQIARAMVTQYGMSDKFGMVALGQQRSRYLGGGQELACSDGTAQEVDAEVERLVEEGHQTALKILKDHRFKLHEIAHYLQKKETITGDEFMKMFTRDDGFAPNLPKVEG